MTAVNLALYDMLVAVHKLYGTGEKDHSLVRLEVSEKCNCSSLYTTEQSHTLFAKITLSDNPLRITCSLIEVFAQSTLHAFSYFCLLFASFILI